jgi:gamma-glutamyltranspeptidase/glutathione hydrolase
VAARLIAGVKAEGGAWTAEEVAAYRVREREPIRFQLPALEHRHRAAAVLGWRGPGADTADARRLGPGTLEGPQRAHLVVEAMRRAYRDRTFYLGDPDFVNVPVARLTSADYAAGLRASIHPQHATPSASFSGQPAPREDTETTHFSIIDAEGNRAGVTQTVNLPTAPA